MAVFIATFLFSLTWQFNQFMMLIQALALFVLDCFDLLPTAKVRLCLEITFFLFIFFFPYHKANSFGGILLTNGSDAKSNADNTLCCFVLLTNHSVIYIYCKCKNESSKQHHFWFFFFPADFISLFVIHFYCLIFG